MRENSKHFIKHLAQGTAILFVVIFALHSLNIIPGYWGEKTLWFFLISLILGAIFVALEIKVLSNDKRSNNLLTSSILYLFITTLIVITLAQFLDIDYLLNLKLELIFLSTILGLLVFYANKKKVYEQNESADSNDSVKGSVFGKNTSLITTAI